MPTEHFLDENLHLSHLFAGRRILDVMFGPLNGVRLALVIAAVLAAITAIFAGFTTAGIVLLVGVALHGAGWLYLYSHRYPDTSE